MNGVFHKLIGQRYGLVEVQQQLVQVSLVNLGDFLLKLSEALLRLLEVFV